MRSIHVLQVLRPMEGGMRRHVLDLISGLQAEGHHVTVACPQDSAIARELSSWVPCIAIELTDGMNPMADFRAVRQLQQAMRREKFDIVHLHGAKPAMWGDWPRAESSRDHLSCIRYITTSCRATRCSNA